MKKKRMPKKKETIVLIDAHAIIHRAYHALPELTTPKGDPAGALYGLSAMLVKLIKELQPDLVVAAYDLPGPTYRHEAYKEYKATRTKTDDALAEQIDRSRDVFDAFHIPILEAPGFEADDVIGTLAASLKKKYSVIIASGDMDTLQLVDGDDVVVFTLRKGLNDTLTYNEKAVKDRFGFAPPLIVDFKGLRGDPSDNIIGVPGIGEKTATTLIHTYGEIEKIYTALEKNVETFRKKTGLSERIANILIEHKEEAEFSKVLASIRHDAPVTFDAKASSWRENFTAEKAKALCTELGFRSLIARIQTLTPDSKEETKEAVQSPESLFNDVDTKVAQEAAVMLWLLQSDITNPTLEDVLNNTNSKTVEEAREKLEADLKKEKLLSVYEDIEKPLIPVISSINDRGIALDKEYLKELSAEYHKELTKIAKRIYKAAGEEFNLNSPKQLSEVLFEKMNIGSGRRKKTSTGQISTKESELEKLKDDHPIIEDILSYRELQKLLSTYIDAIPPLLGKDGRLHTTFVQTGTTTGRISSREPNLQNIPIKTELGRRIRRAFVAPKGKVLMTFDYSQIELRIAAFMSGDEKLKGVFIKGEDVHQAVAAEMFDVPPEKVDHEMRRRAKVINFGILYGMGVNALKANLGVERSEAQEYLNKYFEVYSGLAAYLSKVKATATRVGYTTTFFGRKRYFPGLKSRLPFVRAQAERMAINAPFQGTQADLIKIAMIQIDQLLKEKYKGKAGIVLQIHDELLFEVDKGLVPELTSKIKEVMESVFTTKETDSVPILVSGEVGPNWGEMKKI